ncbi:MAG: response regulator [Candidatus Binatia bacterium]|nr:response regulator [Candidatus Binatia bacterium]
MPEHLGDAPRPNDATSVLPRGHEKILLIDDEPLVGRTAQGLLEALGYAVESTTRSGEALASVREDPTQFDLVVTDQTMPEMTGDTLAREILRIRADMPITLCSGHADGAVAQRAIDHGIREYLTKPVELVQLAESVRRVLDNGTG